MTDNHLRDARDPQEACLCGDSLYGVALVCDRHQGEREKELVLRDFWDRAYREAVEAERDITTRP